MADTSDDLLAPSGGDDLLASPGATDGHAAAQIAHPAVRTGDAVQWAESITTTLAASIVVIAILSWALQRRNARSPLLGFLRLLGLCALPLFILPIGSFATLEVSKRVEFCQSCHTAMDPYVLDMRSEESNTLAAIHFKNRYIQDEQCYQCHADYGVFGAARAKIRGLKHLDRWLAQTSTARGDEQIHHYGPYRNELCLNCHAGSKKFLDAKDGVHRDNAAELTTRDPVTSGPAMPCLQCHGPAHRSLAEWKVKHGVAP
jgi:nitrate/TMAO reductase-like tetraheme cytochrome c subunit